MKICMITLENARDKITWSGTPKNIIECMEEDNVEIVNLSYFKKIHHFGLGKIKNLANKIFYSYGDSFRDPFPFWYKLHSSFFQKEMTKYDVDAYVFMGEQCIKSRDKINGKIYVYLDRVIGEITQYDEDGRLLKSRFVEKYENNDKNSLALMDHIFTLNEWSRDEIIARYGISPRKVTNVGFGVNLREYCGSKNYNNHKLMIVLRKGTEHYKGLDLLLEAFEIARNKVPDLTLHVVGTDYKKLDGVHYYYNLPREVTASLFQECALYVMPALLEPNGITYLEALANKTPVIGLNRFAFPEFCGYGKYGFIVENDTAESVSSAIVDAFSNLNRLEKMGLEGQKFALEKYSWKATADKMLKIMKDDIGG